MRAWEPRAEVVIDPRFNGPPDSGHGGYCAGRAAAALVDAPPGGAVEVTLRRPVPLATPLRRRSAGEGGGVALAAGGELVMTARPGAGARARGASRRSAWRARAGGRRPGPLGRRAPLPHLLRLRARPRSGRRAAPVRRARPATDRFAVAWTPADWAGRDGVAAPEFVWAAVDCPSAAPAAGGDPGRAGPAHARPRRPAGAARRGRRSSSRGRRRVDGRKHHTAVVLHDGAGTVYAHGRATWIAVPR